MLINYWFGEIVVLWIVVLDILVLDSGGMMIYSVRLERFVMLQI